jgi:hypothetical protein
MPPSCFRVVEAADIAEPQRRGLKLRQDTVEKSIVTKFIVGSILIEPSAFSSHKIVFEESRSIHVIAALLINGVVAPDLMRKW